MKVNTKEYIKQLKQHQQLTLDRASQVVNETTLEMFKKIVARTPVGNPALWSYPAPKNYNPGTLKASWAIDYNTNGAVRGTGGRFASFSSYANSGGIRLTLRSGKQTVVIYNNQPYAQRVETGAWSTQAPSGMMRITVAEYSGILNEKAMRYKL